MSRSLGIYTGLLGEGEGDVPVEGDVAEVTEQKDVAEDAVEVSEGENEISEEDEALDDLMDGNSVVEEVQDEIQTVSEESGNNGLSRESAVFAHLALKAAMGKEAYGHYVAIGKFPSVESFTGTSSRQRNTTLTLEGIGQTLKNFWEAIMKQLRKLWASVKNWYLKVLDAAPRMKKRAESLAKKSGEVTGSAGEKSFDMAGLKQLNLSGKAPSPSEATSCLKGLSKGADILLGGTTSGKYEGLFDEYEKTVDKIVDAAGKVKAANLTEFYANDMVKNLNKSLLGKVSDIAKTNIGLSVSGGKIDGGKKRFGADVDATGSDELFGGRQIALTDSTIAPGGDGFTLVRMLRNTGLRFIDYKEKAKDVDGSGSFKTLSTSEIRSLMDEVSDICDHIITYKKAWENRDKQYTKMDTTSKKVIADVERDKDAATLKVRIVKDCAIAFSSAYQMGVRFESQFINYLLAVGRGLIGWAERSLAQYK